MIWFVYPWWQKKLVDRWPKPLSLSGSWCSYTGCLDASGSDVGVDWLAVAMSLCKCVCFIEVCVLFYLYRTQFYACKYTPSPSLSGTHTSFSWYYSKYCVGSMFDYIRLHVAWSYTSSPFSLVTPLTLSSHLLHVFLSASSRSYIVSDCLVPL